jgi:hypothetical protein
MKYLMICSHSFIGKLGKKDSSTVSSPGGDGAIVITYYYPSSIIIPSGVSSINVKLWGAGGAGSSAKDGVWGTVDSIYAGGSGAFVSCDMAVTGGSTIYLLVGQGGQVSSYGANSAVATGGGGNNIIQENLKIKKNMQYYHSVSFDQ